MIFNGTINAPNSVVLLLANSGLMVGDSSSPLIVGQLGVSGVGASALLFGSIGGDSGPDAARLGIHVPQPHSDYLFNGCVIGGINCANTPAASSGVPAAITKAEILSSFPRDEMFAIKLLLTGWAEQDPDATLAQLLDRAGKCVALLKVSPTTSWQSCP